MRSYLEEIAPNPGVPPTPMSQGAGFGVRLLARLVDFLLTLSFGLIAGVCGGLAVGILSGVGYLEGEVETILEGLQVSTLTTIFAAFAYQMVAEGIGGVSLGKLVCGLRVVQTDGRACSFIGAFKRGLLYHFDGLFFGLVGYNSMKDGPLRQRYGDRWAKTVVVHHANFKTTPPVAAWRMVVGLLLASAVWFALVLADMLQGVVY